MIFLHNSLIVMSTEATRKHSVKFLYM